MATLNIGRTSLTTDRLTQWSEEAGEFPVVSLGGFFRGTSKAATRALRDELVSLVSAGFTVPVTWSGDGSLDGFYRALQASVEGLKVKDPGLVSWSLTLERRSKLGRFSSRLTGGLRANQHNLVQSDVEPYVAPPPDADNFDAGTTVPSSVVRNTVQGNIRVYRNVVPADTDDPEWSVLPSDYYDAGARISVNSQERSGLWCPNVPGTWELDNLLVRVKPGMGSRLDVDFSDGSVWESLKTLQIGHTGTADAADAFTEVEEWNAISILRNDAEAAIVRLEGQIATGTRRRWTLDLTLRRGSRFVEGRVVSSDPAQDMKVVLTGAEAGTSITGAVRATSNDADGNRYVVGSSRTFAADVTAGGVEKSNVGKLDFFLGIEFAGTGAQAGDTAAQLVNQYLGYVDEHVDLIA